MVLAQCNTQVFWVIARWIWTGPSQRVPSFRVNLGNLFLFHHMPGENHQVRSLTVIPHISLIRRIIWNISVAQMVRDKLHIKIKNYNSVIIYSPTWPSKLQHTFFCGKQMMIFQKRNGSEKNTGCIDFHFSKYLYKSYRFGTTCVSKFQNNT